MNTEEKSHSVGKEILSIVYGVGIISDIVKLQEDGDDFYVVEFGKKDIKHYFPVNDNKQMRFISTEDIFLSKIKKLKTEKPSKTFQSAKDRHGYFKLVLGNCALEHIVDSILEISSIKELAPNEKEKLSKLIGLLEEETSIIYKKSSKESHDFISDFLQS